MLKPIFFEPGWITTPMLPDGYREFLRAKRAARAHAQKAIDRPSTPQPAKAAAPPTSPAKPASSEPKLTRMTRPVLMRTGAIAAGPAGFLRSLAEQPAEPPEDQRTFEELAAQFWAGQQ